MHFLISGRIALSGMPEPHVLRSYTLLGWLTSSDWWVQCLGMTKIWASQPNSGQLQSSLGEGEGLLGCWAVIWAALKLLSLCSSCFLLSLPRG